MQLHYINMKFSETIYFVSDFNRSVEFYKSIGFDLVELESWGWALFELPGNSKLGLLDKNIWKSEINPVPRIAFESENIEEDYQHLENTGVQVSEITGGNESPFSFTWVDPDGNLFFVWAKP